MKAKRYWVDFYTSGGHCYRSICDCEWKDVLYFKSLAKMLNETIKYYEFNS